jgi:hypothetical protein
MNRTDWQSAFFALAAWAGVGVAASCLSGDDAPAGGRVEHPRQRAPVPVASAEAAPDVSPPPPEETFTPLDHAIADDCSAFPTGSRAWSQHVPDRDCTNDGECGDGFCDRGHCAAIWTCDVRFGQRCIDGLPVPSRREPRPTGCWGGICLEGRCRSCQSDAECATYLEMRFGPEYSVYGHCDDRNRTGGRSCRGVGMTINRPIVP